MSDYLLNKIYDSVLKNKIKKEPTFKTLSESYVSIYEQEINTSTVPLKPDTSQQSIERPEQTIQQSTSLTNTSNWNTEDFNDIIRNKLKSDIPTPVGDYSKIDQLKQVDNQDKAIFKQLFGLVPPKKSGDESLGTKGSGNGEIALYWLLGKNYTAADNRGSGKPDLLLNGKIGIEVKNTDGNTFQLGKYKSQRPNRSMLSVILGVQALFSIAPEQGITKKRKKIVGLDNFNSTDLQEAFKIVFELRNTISSNQNLLEFEVIKNLLQRIDDTFKQIIQFSDQTSIEDLNPTLLTTIIMRKILIEKLGFKPGFDGYIINANQAGNLHVYRPDKSKLEDSKTEQSILKNVYVASGEIVLNRPETILVKI